MRTASTAVFKEENGKRKEKEDAGAADPLQPYILVEETLQGTYVNVNSFYGMCLVRGTLICQALDSCFFSSAVSFSHNTGNSGSLAIRLYFLTEGEHLIAYCQVREESLTASIATPPPVPPPRVSSGSSSP